MPTHALKLRRTMPKNPNLSYQPAAVATPVRKITSAGCFTPDVAAEAFNLEVPSIDDTTLEKPKPGRIRINASAVESQLRRVFQPSIRGQFKVSAEIVKQWNDKKKGRKRLEQLFQSCGFNVDKGCRNTPVNWFPIIIVRCSKNPNADFGLHFIFISLLLVLVRTCLSKSASY